MFLYSDKNVPTFFKFKTSSKFKNLGKCFLQMREIVSESCCTMCNKTWPGSGSSVRNLTRHSSSSPYRYSHTYQCTKKVKKKSFFTFFIFNQIFVQNLSFLASDIVVCVPLGFTVQTDHQAYRAHQK